MHYITLEQLYILCYREFKKRKNWKYETEIIRVGAKGEMGKRIRYRGGPSFPE